MALESPTLLPLFCHWHGVGACWIYNDGPTCQKILATLTLVLLPA